MIPRNINREQMIRQYYVDWGYTIDKISRVTGIPRSTVGYYVNKINKAGQKPIRSSKPISESTRLDDTLSFLDSTLLEIVWEEVKLNWFDFMRNGDYVKATQAIEAMNAMMSAMKHIEQQLKHAREKHRIQLRFK